MSTFQQLFCHLPSQISCPYLFFSLRIRWEFWPCLRHHGWPLDAGDWSLQGLKFGQCRTTGNLITFRALYSLLIQVLALFCRNYLLSHLKLFQCHFKLLIHLCWNFKEPNLQGSIKVEESFIRWLSFLYPQDFLNCFLFTCILFALNLVPF